MSYNVKEKSQQMFGWIADRCSSSKFKKRYNSWKKDVPNPLYYTLKQTIYGFNSDLKWLDNNSVLGSFFKFLGMRAYGSKLYQCGFHLKWPELDDMFLIQWSKKIYCCVDTGNFIDPKILNRWKDDEVDETTEHFTMNLWNPFVIYSYYKCKAPNKRVVCKDCYGDEVVKTHEFEWLIQRKKRLWWDNARVTNRSEDDMTQFYHDLDEYVTRSDY